MKSFSTFILTFFCLGLLLSPLQSHAAPPQPLKPLSKTEKNQLNQPRIYEDTNEKASVKLNQNKLKAEPDQGPQVEAESYILLDDQTGKVVAKKAKDEARAPASMTKMMTAYLVLDQIQRRQIQWDDEVVVSKRAASIDEAQIFLVENERITIKELFIGLMVQSGNDAAVALAEHVAGSEEKFIEQMNLKAKQLGMTNTHYNTANGLDHKDYPDPPNSPGDNVMSAADTAKLARSLIHRHPEIYDFTTITHHTFHPGTDREQKSTNWNKMLPGLKHEYKGVDGIKTGSTSKAGYCFTGTIKRNNKRYISVIMGTASDDKRFTETAKLYDYLFNKKEKKETQTSQANQLGSHPVKLQKAG